MALDLSDKAIAEALQEIKSPTAPNRWVLLGHVGVTPKIRVEEKGETFAELVDELNAGKIFYAICRFSINDMAKFLFLTWCGDSIADQIFKGKFHTFNKDMERYLKGHFHLQINARSEDDIDEEEIKKKLKVATGAFYTQQNLGQKAVSLGEAKQNISTASTSASQKVEKSYSGINKEASNKFWEQQQKEKAETEQKQQLEKERKEKETKAQQQKAKEQQEQLASQKAAAAEEQKAKEAKAAPTKPAVSASSSGIRAKFEQLAVSQPATPASSTSRPAPKPLQSKFGQAPAPAKEEPKPAPAKPIGKLTPPAAVSKPAPAPTPAPVPTPAPAKLPPPPKQPEPEPEEDEFEPPRQEPEPEEQELPAPAEEAFVEEPQPVEEVPAEPEPQPEPEPEPEPVQEPEPEPEPVQEPIEETAPSSGGQIAVGVFDFNTEDSEELPFLEGDTLTILKSEGDWWLAEKDGRKGFIPANYVELK